MDERQKYEISVRGRLSEIYLEWLEGFEIVSNDCNDQFTKLSGYVVDQSCLRGMINKLFDLNIEIISIQQIIDG